MVDPDQVLGDDWQEEFENHLTGSTTAADEGGAGEDLEEELNEFIVPEALPQLPKLFSNKVVAVGLQAPIIVEITGGFVRAGIELIIQENGADALTKIQELRQKGLVPYLLVDLEAPAITDGRTLGGLEIVSTMWDFGFHLPVGLICRREVESELGSKLQDITGLTVIPLSDPIDKSSVRQILETIIGTIGTSQAPQAESEEVLSSDMPEEDQHSPEVPSQLSDDEKSEIQQTGKPMGEGEDYFDIEQEFSEELGDIDLPFDGWEETKAPLQKASLDPHMARLSSYVNELNSQDVGGEITLLALRFASAFTNRAILFLARKDDIKGLGQFGVDLGQDRDADSVVRSLSLPLEEKSLFQKVAQHQQSYKGPPTGSATEKALFEALGGGVPGEIFIGPIVSMGKVAVLLYGDDFPLCEGLEPTHTLDIFLSHVGLALDRAFLEMKLKSQRS